MNIEKHARAIIDAIDDSLLHDTAPGKFIEEECNSILKSIIWIPASDRLPEENRDVWMRMGDGTEKRGYRYKNGNGEVYWPESFGNRVVAWRELI